MTDTLPPISLIDTKFQRTLLWSRSENWVRSVACYGYRETQSSQNVLDRVLLGAKVLWEDGRIATIKGLKRGGLPEREKKSLTLRIFSWLMNVRTLEVDFEFDQDVDLDRSKRLICDALASDAASDRPYMPVEVIDEDEEEVPLETVQANVMAAPTLSDAFDAANVDDVAAARHNIRIWRWD